MRHHITNIRGLEVGTGSPVSVMGALNLSPESFYSGSVVTSSDQIAESVRGMEQEGADIIDVGAASTAPRTIYGTAEVGVEEELGRIRESLGLIIESTRLPISIDTTSSSVAETALDTGASLVNDTSGLRADDRMAKLVVDRAVPIVIMANCGGPCPSVEAALDSITTSIKTAMNAGVDPSRIIVDPGIGFGKATETDCAILRNLGLFSLLGHPLLVGVSRKAFIGGLLSLPDPAMRLTGTIAATSVAVVNGANIIRAHDVKEACAAVKIGEALRNPLWAERNDVELLSLCNEREAELAIGQVGAGPDIAKHLANKAVILNFLVRNVGTPAALILKQEMLALGGDAAYHHDVIDRGIDCTDVLVMGTRLQLNKLVKRIVTIRDFGLAGIGSTIRDLMAEHMAGFG